MAQLANTDSMKLLEERAASGLGNALLQQQVLLRRAAGVLAAGTCMRAAEGAHSQEDGGSLGVPVLGGSVHEAIHIGEQHQQVCAELARQLLGQAVIVLEAAQLVLRSPAGESA